MRQVILKRCCVLHFTGHGIHEADGQICFEDDYGTMHPINEQTLQELFRRVCLYTGLSGAFAQAVCVAPPGGEGGG